jgi:hypothetical protein
VSAKSRQMENPAATLASAPEMHPQRWYRRVSFWRAIAGMALAVVLGGAIAVSETASTLLHRNRHYQHQIAQLKAHIRAMRAQLANTNQQLVSMRSEAALQENLTQTIAAPDSAISKLQGPGKSAASGMLVASSTLNRAFFEASGIAPIGAGEHYTLWLLPRNGAPIGTPIYELPAGGRLLKEIPLPTRSALPAEIVVTLERGDDAVRPSGPIILRGHVAAIPQAHLPPSR